MSSFQSHPDDGLLLRHFDGELKGRQAKQVERHLAACWQCRTHVEELQSTVAECMKYREQVLETHLPAPPAAWSDLPFSRVDAESIGDSWGARAARWFGSPAVRRWAISGAVAAAVAAGVFYQLRETPSVEAAALLQRAVTMAETRPLPKRQIRVRTRTQQFTLADRAAAPVVRALFETAHYNSEDPLSAKSYQAWREGLRAKSDEIAASAESYRIRTAAPEGAIAVASLTLRATDLRPVEGRFEFRNQEWVELTEVAEASTRDGGLSIETNVELPMRRAVPSRPVTAPSDGTASISEELQVLAALHEIGADLGDPVEVTQNSGKTIVSGVGVLPERQQRIRRALDAMPNVTVHFENPASASVPDAPGIPAAGNSRQGAMQARVEEQLGGRAAFARFSTHLLDATEALMPRAYALRALAQRFPAEKERAMQPADRQTLGVMAREHAMALSEQANDIQRTLAPVLVSLGGETAQGKPVTPRAQWQAAAEDLLQSARRAEVLLSLALGATPSTGAAEPSAADVMAAIGDLRMQIAQFERLISR